MNAARLSFLVVDDQAHQRRLITETLRQWGAARIDQAASVDDCFKQLRFFPPHILITDWDMAQGTGIDLVKSIRAGSAGAQLKKLPVIMVTERNTLADIETARNCGIDEFILKPFSTAGLISRIEAVLENRRDFVDSQVYIGPCRRRKMLIDYDGPLRRLFDDDSDEADAPEIQMKKALARKHIVHANGVMRELSPGDRTRLREIFKANREILSLAGQMKDKMLMAASESLKSYLEGVGASPRLNPEVLEAHVDAMTKLVDLPNAQADLRNAVTRALSALVQKKLHGGAAA